MLFPRSHQFPFHKPRRNLDVKLDVLSVRALFHAIPHACLHTNVLSEVLNLIPWRVALFYFVKPQASSISMLPQRSQSADSSFDSVKYPRAQPKCHEHENNQKRNFRSEGQKRARF